MRKFRIFYQNNKNKIWKIVGITILIVVGIQIINYELSKKSQEELEKSKNVSNNSIVKNNDVYLPSNPIIENSTITKKEAEEDTKLIEQFIESCNNQRIEEAYELISKDCKKELFPTVQDFYNNYYKDIFNIKRSYDIEAWIFSGITTYKIKILNDIMADGKAEEEYIEDYYTVVSEEKNNRLNIKGFIKKEDINKEIKEKDINFKIINESTYMEYLEYTVVISNNLDETVIIDSKEDTKSIFLKDDNGVNYYWFGNEIDNKNLIIESGKEKTIKIKFNKLYNPKRKNQSINFNDIQIQGIKEAIKVQIKM